MEESAFEKKQQKLLDVFFKETFAKSNIHFGYWLVTGIMLFLQGIFICIPWQMFPMQNAAVWWTLFLGTVGASWYIQPYIQCTNSRGMVDVMYNRLRYLPMSAKILRKYRLKKLFAFQKKVYLVMQLLQLVFSIVALHEITVGNFLYPILFCFISPIFVVGINILIRK